LLQTACEAAQHQWPQVLQLFAQPPTTRNLRSFEKEVQSSSLTARVLRPWVQAAQFFGLRQAGQSALVGRDGWLFYQPGVNFLTQRPGREDSSWREALAAVRDFRDALRARGIGLLLMPAPNKESIYPEKLSAKATLPQSPLSPDTRAFLKACEAAGIEVVDLFTLYSRARTNSAAPLYLVQDSHWSPEGVVLAAKAVAARICLTPKMLFEARRAPVQRLGDIVRMLRSPIIERHTAPESLVCQQIVRKDTGVAYADDPASDVLVLGDSFLRIYQQDEPGHAGFIAQLALALGRPLASIVNDGGASTLVRQELFRRPHLLEHTKFVVWEFVERDLRLGTEGWGIVPLPAKANEAKPPGLLTP